MELNIKLSALSELEIAKKKKLVTKCRNSIILVNIRKHL